MKSMSDYHINIFHSEKDGGYIADIPDLAGCSAFGTTPEEDLAEVLIARNNWITAAKENKKPIPRPRYKPTGKPIKEEYDDPKD